MPQHDTWLIRMDKKLIRVIGTIILILAATSAAFAYYAKRPISEIPSTAKVLAASTSNCKLDESDQKVKSYVVRIENKTDDGVITGNGFFEENGYLVTNSHIVAQKGQIKVHFSNGDISKARLISNDRYKDLAILVVDKKEVTSLPWGNVKSLNIGDNVALLNGDTDSDKSNIAVISARKSYDGINFLQTDIGVDENNSGTPLINSCGEIVGISLYSKDINVNLSIDAVSAKQIISSLITNKDVEYASTNENTSSLLNDSVAIEAIGLKEAAVKATKGDQSDNNEVDTSVSSNSAPSCNTINSDKNYLNVDDEALLSFSYKGAEGEITWTGSGVFSSDQDPSAKYSIVKWSNTSSGKYDLTVVAKNKFGECKQTISMTVNSPHISGTLSVTGDALVKASDGSYYAEVNSPIIITASGTTTNNYNIVATSTTGYGGSVSGTVTNKMTFVPPTEGTYTFTLTGNSGVKGDSISIIVQNVIGSLSVTGSALVKASDGSYYAEVNKALTITASNTLNNNYNIVTTSTTGYGGSVSGTVTNKMTFVPPTEGTYTFTLTSKDGLAGFSVPVRVQNIVGTISISGNALSKNNSGNYFSKIGSPIVATVSNTLNNSFIIRATSDTGYGGTINGVVTNQMTFIPPVAGNYTFYVESYDGVRGDNVSVTVQ